MPIKDPVQRALIKKRWTDRTVQFNTRVPQHWEAKIDLICQEYNITRSNLLQQLFEALLRGEVDLER